MLLVSSASHGIGDQEHSRFENRTKFHNEEMTFGVLVCQRDAGSEVLWIMSQLPKHYNIRRTWHLGRRRQCVHRNFHAQPVPVSEFTGKLRSLMKFRHSRVGSPGALKPTKEQELRSPEGWTVWLCVDCSNAIVKSKGGLRKFSRIPLTTAFAQRVQMKQRVLLSSLQI